MVTIRKRLLTMLMMLTMIPFVASWFSTSRGSLTQTLHNCRHQQVQHTEQQVQPSKRRSVSTGRLGVANRNSYTFHRRTILTRRRMAKRDDDDDNVKGGTNKKGDATEESSGLFKSLGNLFPFSKSSSSGKDTPAAAAKDKTAVAKDEKKDSSSSSSTTSWWRRKSTAPEAEAKIPPARSSSSSSSVNSPRQSPANMSPPPLRTDRSKDGIVRDKKVIDTTRSIKQASNITSIENLSLVNRFQSLWNSTMQWNQQLNQPQLPGGTSANKTMENPVSVVLKFFGSAATDLKTKSEQDWGGYLGNAQKFVLDAASGGMKRFTKSSDDSEEWLPVFPKTRISPGEMVPATIADIDVLVIASSDGRKLYCIANSCPHLGTPLETGMLERRPIESNPSTSIQSSSSKTSSTPTKTADTTTTSDDDDTDDTPYLISEMEVMKLLQEDGCEDCIVCPLHHTAFALASGQVRGEWCPYPPVIGKIMGTVNAANPMAVFDIRYKGKNVEVRLNTPTTDAEENK